ncbi:MAG: gluconate kinase [Pseudopedobacter saltans]|uniref:Gluconokinase n=1 Tax=Pseudopedobacter saltans TaxID=151895 RepID=A0A2W5H7R4_9SPHI|nr:MAG: gluconate kinase [Pseudopedobacter saltans]
MNKATCIIVMGVSGSGKTTIGKYIAQKINAVFQDGDNLHPKNNIEKMSNGIPLDDKDREPWLEKIGKVAMNHLNNSQTIIIACSALKRIYRDQLRREIHPIKFLYLEGTYGQILKQISERKKHFMPASLLKTQFDILEKPSTGEHDVTTITIGNGEKERIDQKIKSPSFF